MMAPGPAECAALGFFGTQDPSRRARAPRSVRMTAPASSESASGLFRIQTPSKGAKRTATTQEMTSAMATTAKIENVYSPAALRAKPIGTKPTTVTSVPVSIGKAVEV